MRYLTLLLFSTALSAQGALSVTVSTWGATCGNPTGKAMAAVSEGVPPYTYSWDNGGTTELITGLAPGTYTVTVTDGNNDQAQASGIVDVLPDLGTYGQDMFGLGQGTPCEGVCNGSFRFYMPGLGQEPINVSTNPPMALEFSNQDPLSLWTVRQYNGACAGQVVDIYIVDDFGCTGSAQVTMAESVVPDFSVVSTTGSCTNGYGGTATVEVNMPLGAGVYEPWWALYALDGSGNTIGAGLTVDPNEILAQYTLFGLPPGNWTARITNNFGGADANMCEYDVPFSIADVGPGCGELTGVIHHESNQNCIQDNGEVGVPNRVLEFQPGPFYAITGPSGSYQVDLPYGNYTLSQVGTGIQQLCPPSVPIVFAMNPGQSVINIADSIGSPFDLMAYLSSTPARPGFLFTYHLHASNNSAYPGEATTLDFAYSTAFTFVSSSFAPSMNTPGSLQFQIPDIAPFGALHITVTLQVPADVGLIGSQHAATLTASSALTEDLGNNTASNLLTVTGSYDPNDKQVRTSSGGSDTEYLIVWDDWVDYTIRFQNTGTDTAFNVVVIDTLSAIHDVASLQVLGASHAYTPEIRNGHVLKFTFSNILLPDSNTNEPASHGYIAFRLRPYEVLGEVIENEADIYFDFNPPIITNTTALNIAVETGAEALRADGFAISPNPAEGLVTLRVPQDRIIDQVVVRSSDGRVLLIVRGRATIDVSDFAPGIYTLEASEPSGRSSVLRFVKD